MTQYFGVDPLSAPWWLVATQVNSLCFSCWVLNYFKPCDVSFQNSIHTFKNASTFLLAGNYPVPSAGLIWDYTVWTWQVNPLNDSWWDETRYDSFNFFHL